MKGPPVSCHSNGATRGTACQPPSLRLEYVQDELADLAEVIASIANVTQDATFTVLALSLANAVRVVHEARERFAAGSAQ